MSFLCNLTPFLEASHDGPPSRIGQRYDVDRFLPEAGNTIVCHLDQTDPAHAAVLEARARMQALPGAENCLYTPESSIHMTVFEGVIETRRTPDAWPAGLDRDASVDTVTEVLLHRLAGFQPPPPFAMRLVGMTPNGLILGCASPEDDAAMNAWREALADAFGYRHTEHDTYRFHMTFAYMTAWLPDEVTPEWERALPEICADLAQAAPVIPLRAPAFCTFNDMTHFEERLVLAQ